jgi:hypothetical protein
MTAPARPPEIPPQSLGKCGCLILEMADGLCGIRYCPVHLDAPATAALLREALPWVEYWLKNSYYSDGHWSNAGFKAWCEKARALLARTREEVAR